MSIRINVGATFDARDLKAARRELDALEDKARGLNTTMGRVGRGMQNFGQSTAAFGVAMTQAVTVPILGAATAATKMAADFSESMSRITGLVGIAADEVKAMESAVLALSGETAKSPKELAEALFVVTSAGLRGAEAMDALEAAAKAGAAGLGATNDIARAVSGAMNAYGAETLSAARATDIIVATARAGNFATDQFAGALGRVLPFAQQAQASLEDVGGAVALLTRTNGNAAESITQIQALFRAFVVPSEEAKKILDEVGLSAADLRKEMGERGLVSALRLLDGRLDGNRERLGRLLSSTEAASAAFQILNADSATIADTFGVVGDSVGMTGDAFGVVSGQPAFKFRQALNEIQIASINLGNQLLPIATKIIEKFAELVQRFNELTPAQRDNIIKWGAIIAIIGPAITLFGALVAIIGGVVIALGLMSTAMIVATGGLVLLGAAIATIAFKKMTKDTSDAAEALRLEARAADHAAAGNYALAEAEAKRARELRGRSAFNEAQIAQDLRMADAVDKNTDAQDAGAAVADAMADAMAGLGASTEDATDAIGKSGPKVVALTSSMRDLFRGINETTVGTGSAGDAIAQFSREVLSMGKITEGTSRGAERLAQVIRQDIDRSLADANRRLEEATGLFNAFRDAIAAGVRQGNTLSDAARSQTSAIEALTRAEEAYADAVASGDEDRIRDAADALKDAKKGQNGFLDFLLVGVTTAEGFAAQIEALRKAGASLEVVQQIAELGAETGGRIAAELLAGGAAAIEQANNMVTAVENASKRAGVAAAEQFFSAGVNAAKAMVRGIEATIPELQSVLDRIADAIERAMGARPNVDITGKQGPFIPQDAGVSGVTAPKATRLTALPSSLSRVRQDLDEFPGIRMMAEGGLVMGPTFAMVGEAGPEMVIPLDRAGSMGNTVVNITVTSADPQAVVEAIKRYTRLNGPLSATVKI
jgi:TP901 family phage tail tape measure protein